MGLLAVQRVRVYVCKIEIKVCYNVYYMFSYADFTTQSSTDEGLWFKNGTVQLSKLKLLSRTYAQVCELHIHTSVSV